MNQVIDLLNSHRSIRKFKSEPVTNEIVHTIIQAGSFCLHIKFHTGIQCDPGDR